MYKKIIQEICEEENIDFQLLSEDWIIKLSKNNCIKYITGYKFPLNDHAISNILDDKYALYCVCSNLNINIIPHHILFKYDSTRGINTKKDALKYFNEYNQDVIIKPNNGSLGKNVYHINNINKMWKILKKIFIDNYSVSICPFYNIDSEYRVVILDNKVKLTYEKIRPIVFGDGIHTIKELLIDFNPFYFTNKLTLKKYNRVLKMGECYEYDFKFNLSRGAIAKKINDKKLEEKINNMALYITKKINANFVTVDIVKVQNELYLLEVNSGVCINKACNFIDQNYKITKQIYKEAILKMFQ